MDKQEARDLLAKALAPYRAETWEQLQRLLKTSESSEVKGRSGTTYQVKVHACWDDWGSGGDLRIMGDIDDGGWRAFAPLCDAFIIAPDGRFVGEGPSPA